MRHPLLLLSSASLALVLGVACSPSNEPSGGGGAGGNATGGSAGGSGSTSGGSAGASSGGAPNGGTTSGGTGGSAGAGGPQGGASGTGTGGALGGAGQAMGGGAGVTGSAGDSGAAAGQGGAPGGTGGGGAGGGAAGSNALFSDGFEDSAIDMTKWTLRVNGGGMFSIDTSRKHGGNSSLRVQANNGYSTLLAKEGAPIFPAPNNQYFARVWFYVPTPLPTNHVIWVEGGTVANDSHEVRIGMHLGYGQINLWQNGEVDIREPTAPMRPDAWICLEFRMGNDVLEVWMDGARVDGLSTTTWVAANPANGSNTTPKTAWSPTYAAFRLGWELNAGTSEIWYDDVALGHDRIGCN